LFEEKRVKNNRKKPVWYLTAVVALFVVLLAACQAAPPASPTAEPAPTTPVPAAAATDAAPPTPAPTATPIVLEGATVTESGLQYLEVQAGQGAAPERGNVVTMHFIATLPDGAILANTYTQDEPARVVWGTGRLLPGWEESLGMMNAGGKARLIMTPELAFGEEGAASVPPETQLLFEVELLEVTEAPAPTPVAEADLTRTDSGLGYYDLVEGDGDEALPDWTASMLYTMWIKTDTGYEYVDQSVRDAPVSFVVGRRDVVFPGWDEGATGMKVGGKRQLIIPADLGMGEQGAAMVPPDAVMVMEIELIEITQPQVAAEVDEDDYITTASGLKYYDLVAGEGDTPETGQTAVVHYTGWLADGAVFDSSIQRGQPLSFQVGLGGVIPGWDEGVASMQVGGKRQLVIPPDLGYGETGSGGVIPPNATLIFEVELLEILP